MLLFYHSCPGKFLTEGQNESGQILQLRVLTCFGSTQDTPPASSMCAAAAAAAVEEARTKQIDELCVYPLQAAVPLIGEDST